MARSSSSNFEAAVTLIVMGSAGVYSGWKRHRQVRAVEDTPCHNIQSAPQGLVEIQGHALPYESSSTSLDGRDTVYRTLRIEKRVKRGKSYEWVTVATETQGEHFVISDGTGIAIVNVLKAEMMVNSQKHPWKSLPMETRRYIVKKHRTSVPDLSISPGFFSSTFRVVETALFVGGPVYVRGSFKTLKDQVPYVIEPQYLHFLAELANLKRVPGKRNRLFDLDRNGRVCEYELHFGSKMLLSRAKRKVQKDEKPEKVLIQGTLQNDSVHGLMIGDCHQDQLTHRLGALNFLRIIGGAAAIAGGVSLLIFG